MTDDPIIKKEIRKLKATLKDLDKKELKAAEKLIENCAFMAVQLDKLADDIKENGYTEEYQNGQNQFGKKRSVAFDGYNTMIKNYTAAIKVLTGMLPPGQGSKAEDELLNYIGLNRK